MNIPIFFKNRNFGTKHLEQKQKKLFSYLLNLQVKLKMNGVIIFNHELLVKSFAKVLPFSMTHLLGIMVHSAFSLHLSKHQPSGLPNDF